MLMPSIFGENLFDDDWMNFGFNDNFWGKKNPLYGKHAQNMKQTSAKKTTAMNLMLICQALKKMKSKFS